MEGYLVNLDAREVAWFCFYFMCKVWMTPHGLIFSEEWMGGRVQGSAWAGGEEGEGTVVGI